MLTDKHLTEMWAGTANPSLGVVLAPDVLAAAHARDTDGRAPSTDEVTERLRRLADAHAAGGLAVEGILQVPGSNV